MSKKEYREIDVVDREYLESFLERPISDECAAKINDEIRSNDLIINLINETIQIAL